MIVEGENWVHSEDNGNIIFSCIILKFAFLVSFFYNNFKFTIKVNIKHPWRLKLFKVLPKGKNDHFD